MSTTDPHALDPHAPDPHAPNPGRPTEAAHELVTLGKILIHLEADQPDPPLAPRRRDGAPLPRRRAATIDLTRCHTSLDTVPSHIDVSSVHRPI